MLACLLASVCLRVHLRVFLFVCVCWFVGFFLAFLLVCPCVAELVDGGLGHLVFLAYPVLSGQAMSLDSAQTVRKIPGELGEAH